MKISKPPKYFFIIFLGLSVIFLITRLQHLTSIPVFGDEAIYLRWSQIIKNEETMRFVPLSDGKQPLFMWLTVPLFKIITDPLVAGRLLSVLSGLGISILLFLIMYLVINHYWLSLVPVIIYLFLPYSFFFDRLSLADNLLSFWGTLTLFITVLLAKYPRFDLSMILGVSLGLAWLTKSPAIYFLFLSALTFLFLSKKNLRLWYLPAISVLIAFVIYNLLRLGPQFQMISLRNKDYLWTISDILRHPFDPLIPHFLDLLKVYWQYLGLTFVFIIGLFKTNHQRIAAVFLIWWLIPVIINLAMSKTFTARYVLYCLPPLILSISLGFIALISRYKYLLFLIFLIPNLVFIYQLSLHPFSVTLPASESGYLSDWTSGWGIKEAAVYLKDRSKIVNVIAGTEGRFGTLPDGLQIYSDHIPQLTIIGVGLDFEQLPSNLVNARQFGDEVYLLINHSRNKLVPLEVAKLELIASYPKPDNDLLQLYRFR